MINLTKKELTNLLCKNLMKVEDSADDFLEKKIQEILFECTIDESEHETIIDLLDDYKNITQINMVVLLAETLSDIFNLESDIDLSNYNNVLKMLTEHF